MKKIIPAIFLIFMLHPVNGQNQEFIFNEFEIFLKENVRDGLVDYEKVYDMPEELDRLAIKIADFNVENLPQDGQRAFYINTYNTLVIQGVILNYPVKSPQDIAGFFDKRKNNVGGKWLTLNDLENLAIGVTNRDPRIHFVLICATLGCPEISKLAYRPANLDKQLDQRARFAINDSTFIRVRKDKKKVLISPIFEWYRKDFVREGDNILEYINRYREEKIDPNFKVGYYTYDWRLNINKSTGGVSNLPESSSNIIAYTPSVLLKKEQIEIKSFNNVYTQTSFDSNGEKVDLDERQTFYTGIFQLTYGISNSSRVNIGFDVYLNSVKYKPLSNSNLESFGRTAIGSFGPRIKVSPFGRIPTFSIQSTLLFPVANNLESPRFLAHDRLTWWNQLFFDKTLGRFQIFVEADLMFRFRKSATFIRTPTSLFINYYPSQKITFYGFIQHSPRFDRLTDGSGSSLSRTAWFSQAGIGIKYQFIPRLNIELLATDFFTAKNDGLGKTYNIGFRFIN